MFDRNPPVEIGDGLGGPQVGQEAEHIARQRLDRRAAHADDGVVPDHR